MNATIIKPAMIYLRTNYVRLIPFLFIFIISIIIGMQVPNFLGQRNLINILNQSSAIGIMAIGMTMVFLVGGIDLSIAANMGFSSIIGAMLMRDGLNPFIACLIMILVSALIGTINGYAVSYLNMIPFVVTLSMMYVTAGASVWITESTSITGLPDSFVDTILTKIWGIPLPVFIMLFLGIVSTIYIKSTIHGRWIYAVGTNITAAGISGIPVKKVKLWAYILAGVFAGLGAILNTARLASASATMGQSVVVLDVASSAVVGGVSIYGGIGTPIMAIIGALLITLISNSMNMLGVSYYFTLVIKGFVIITFIGFDAWLRRRQ
jgi:ribose/xylose/arabinose/galactoside ABC-type transport system permease subunit